VDWFPQPRIWDVHFEALDHTFVNVEAACLRKTLGTLNAYARPNPVFIMIARGQTKRSASTEVSFVGHA
jgi:hypothetical protein